MTLTRGPLFLTLLLSLASVPAHAGRARATAEAAPADPYAVPELAPVGLVKVDLACGAAHDVVQRAADTRRRVDEARIALNTSMGLVADTPFDHAVAELHRRTLGHVTAVPMERLFPYLSQPTDLSAELVAAVETYNRSADTLQAGLREWKDASVALTERIGSCKREVDAGTTHASDAGLSRAAAVEAIGTGRANLGKLDGWRKQLDADIAALEALGPTVAATLLQ